MYNPFLSTTVTVFIVIAMKHVYIKRRRVPSSAFERNFRNDYTYNSTSFVYVKSYRLKTKLALNLRMFYQIFSLNQIQHFHRHCASYTMCDSKLRFSRAREKERKFVPRFRKKRNLNPTDVQKCFVFPKNAVKKKIGQVPVEDRVYKLIWLFKRVERAHVCINRTMTTNMSIHVCNG